MTEKMTRADQASLRSLIRQRFKVLRADVAAREAELHQELAARVTAADAGRDKEWNDALFLISEAAKEGNRKANDALRALGWPELDLDGKEYEIVTARSVGRPDRRKQHEMKAEGQAKISARVRKALADLDRIEADVLTDLTIRTLDSDAARQFLESIPTVGDLVPAERLLAIAGIEPTDTT